MEGQEALAIEVDKAKIQKVMNIYGTKTERETIDGILDDIIYMEEVKTASEEEMCRKEESDTLHKNQQVALHPQRYKVAQPPSLLLNITKFTHFSSGFIGENLTLEEYTNLSEKESFLSYSMTSGACSSRKALHLGHRQSTQTIPIPQRRLR